MVDGSHPSAAQPLLHDAVVALRAPTQVWSAQDGGMGGDGSIHGVYVSDVRVLGRLPDHSGRVRRRDDPRRCRTTPRRLRFVTLHREFDDSGSRSRHSLADTDPGRAVLTGSPTPSN